MSTEQFVAALSEYHLDATEIAEILWLVMRQPHIDVSVESEAVREEESQDGNDVAASNAEGMSDTSGEDGGQQHDADKAEEPPPFDLASQVPSGVLPSNALPISVPDAGFLEDTLPLVRALKPLLKLLESQTARYVNEAATVDLIAETDIWSPVLQPGYEPWFDVALVIDSSVGMGFWQRLIQDIQRLLRCYGSFRDFRIWELVVADGEVGICAVPDRTQRPPKALLPPDSRRLALVFSDCTADYWWDGSLQPALALWGNAMPTAVWQVLPDWMWKRTALGVGEYVTIRNRIPGAVNKELQPIFLSLRPSVKRRVVQGDLDSTAENTPGSSICVPVITTNSESLGAWSRMLTGDHRQPSPGFVLPATGWAPVPLVTEVSSADTRSQDDPLEQFRLRATPSARRLAALLSAAPVITLPVMRLICASMLPGASPLPVAEVFLGGLLKSAPDQPEDVDAELVQYILPEETRDRLLDILPKFDAISVIEAVSQYVAERLNCTLADFRALLLSPDLRAEADRYGLRAFAQVTAQILRKLGRDYETLADQFEFPQEPAEQEPLEEDTFPELQTLEDSTSLIHREDVPEFPLIQTKDVRVVTITPSDFPFSIEVATIERGDSEESWPVQRQSQQAHRYIEPLRNGVSITMVAIPGGRFIMGSPDDEPERDGSEGPQHEVQVQGFFMGRYPITQAQWKEMAGFPEVNQPLDPDPSYFKGENHPLERVSWHDAVEFCARLSAYTQRDYRLPTEAEWEYACRAGTTTPFHFGEMINTDVANYSGSSYNDGPAGEYREETTPVDLFKVANTFGLSDMHGNVLEWCQDHWHENYENAPTNGSAWLTEDDVSYRVLRGGSWSYTPWSCRSASRFYALPNYSSDRLGFRVVCSAPRALQ